MPITIDKTLQIAAKKLKENDNETAWLDAKILLMHILKISKEEIFLKAYENINKEDLDNFMQLVEKRIKKIPIAQIIGAREFYGRKFKVTSDTLDPRADTETLIEATKSYYKDGNELNILEIGTGTGCIAITLAAEMNNCHVTALDISEQALKIGIHNCKAHNLTQKITFLHSDLFQQLEQKAQFDLIVSNPPYIKTSDIESLQDEVRLYEPKIALDGGEDGLTYYQNIAEKAHLYLKPSGKISFEIGQGQEKDICNIMQKKGYALLSSHKDLNNITRALIFSS